MGIAALLFLFHVTGCNTDDDRVAEPPQNAPVERNNEAGAIQSSIPFTSFDLDVDDADNKDFNVDYDNERDGMEAEIEDELSDRHLKGDEALKALMPIFEQLSFDKDTLNEDVIAETLDAFQLDGNYESFELEIRFIDGTEKEYEARRQQ